MLALPPGSGRRLVAGEVFPPLELTLWRARYVLVESKEAPGVCHFALREKGPWWWDE